MWGKKSDFVKTLVLLDFLAEGRQTKNHKVHRTYAFFHLFSFPLLFLHSFLLRCYVEGQRTDTGFGRGERLQNGIPDRLTSLAGHWGQQQVNSPQPRAKVIDFSF